MITKVKMIVADIDGTLVNSKHELTDKTKDVIKELHDRGILFGIASGRAIDGQLEYRAKEWGFDFQFDIIIGMNGSQLFDGINNIRTDQFLLKKEYIKEIIEKNAHFNINPVIFDGGKTIAARSDKDADRRRSFVVDNIEELWSKDCGKVLYGGTKEQIDAIAEFEESHPSPYYRGFRTQPIYYEFMDVNVSKAVALEQFCKTNNIDINEVMAFGDITNDDEMLKVAGWGVCLLNGAESTKAIADDVTEKTNDEDGLAHYIEKHVLNNK